MIERKIQDLHVGDIYTHRGPECQFEPELFSHWFVTAEPSREGMFPGVISHRAARIFNGWREGDMPTEDFTTHTVWVLGDDERAEHGYPPHRETCAHPVHRRSMTGGMEFLNNRWVFTGRGRSITTCGHCKSEVTTDA